MLLGVLFSVRFNNFDQTTSFYWSYTLLLELPVLMSSWFELDDRMIFNFCTGQFALLGYWYIVTTSQYVPCLGVLRYSSYQICSLSPKFDPLTQNRYRSYIKPYMYKATRSITTCPWLCVGWKLISLSTVVAWETRADHSHIAVLTHTYLRLDLVTPPLSYTTAQVVCILLKVYNAYLVKVTESQ